jgi:hypothetical protein
MSTYLSSLPPGINHPAIPLVDFIATVAEYNDSTCQAVFDSGFLNVLICMYACNFSPHAIGSVDEFKARHSIIEAVCAALATLCRQPSRKAVISSHPIGVLWPKNELLLSILGNRTAERQAIWRKLGHVVVGRRLSSLRTLLQSPSSTKRSHMTELSDAQVDLKEFAR